MTDAHTNDRAEIQQFDCNYRIGKCLDIPGATGEQTFIWQYHCTDNNVAQMFTFPP